jgi:hypothetical protein
MLSTLRVATVRHALAERFEVRQCIGQAGVLHDRPVELSTVVLTHTLVRVKHMEGEIEGPELHLATSVERLLEMLAAQDEPFIDDAFLREKEECPRSVIRAVEYVNLGDLLQQMPEAPTVGSKRRFYAAGQVLAEPLGVNETRGFHVQDRRIAIAWTRWKLVLPVGILERLGTGMAQTMVEITCEGSFQIWVRLGDDASVDVEVSSVGALKIID